MMKTKRLSWCMMLLLSVPVLISGCTGGEGKPKIREDQAAYEPFEMTIRHTQVGEAKKYRLALLNDVVRKTEAEVPGLKFHLDGVDAEVNRKEKLRGEMASGKPPDIFDVFGSPETGVYAREKLLLDLTPILGELGIRDQFNTLDPFTHDGKVYGLPIGGSIEGIFYNREYFERHGLQVPKTLGELEKVAEFIKADGKIPFAQSSKEAWIPLMTTNNLWSYYAGPEITYGFRTGETEWTDPMVVKAFEKQREWVAKGYYPKGQLGLEYTDMRNRLINGEAIMMMDGSWANTAFRDPEQAGDMAGKIGFFNLPPLHKGDPVVVMQDANNGYGFSASVTSDPRKMAAVKAFIRHMWNGEMQLRGLKEDGVLPAMKMDAATMNATSSEPIMQDIFKAVSEIDNSFPAYDALVQVPVNTALSLGIQQVISGEIEPRKMLENVQRVQETANAEER